MLVERESAIAQFSLCVDKLTNTSGHIALISGEAGIGKTTFLEQAKQLFGSYATFYWSGCDPLLTPRPFGPVHDIAAELSTPLLAMLEKGASTSSIYSAFYQALESSSEPNILIFEDVHWADHATLDLFKFLARRIAFVKCMLVISYRDDEVGETHPFRTVLDVLPSSHTSRISIAPLTVEGIAQLAQNSQHDSATLLKVTAGNPFYITELLAVNNTDINHIPASVKEAITFRLKQLPHGERTFLETICLVPNAISPSLLQALCGVDGETNATACAARNLLTVDDAGSYRFRHELARLGTITSLTVSQQKRLHQRIVEALELSQGVDALALLIHHSSAALDAQRVLKYAPVAAKDAAKNGAHREAAAYLNTALYFVSSASTELAAQLYEQWAYEAGLTMHIDDQVIAARQQAITLWRTLGRLEKVGENMRYLSRLHWYRGEATEAENLANESIKIIESVPITSGRIMAYSFRAQLDMLNDRMQAAIDWGNRALLLEAQFPNHEIRIHALNNLGSAKVLRGDETGEALLYESLSLAIEHGFHEHAARVYTNFSDYCIRYKKLDLAETLIAAGIAFDTSFDLDSWTFYLIGMQAQLRVEQGRLEDAQTISQGVLALDKLTLLMKLPALSALAKAQLRLGTIDVSQRISQVLENAYATDELQYIIPARFCAIEAAWLQDEPNVALTHLTWLSQLDACYLDHWRAGELIVWIKRFGFDLKSKFSCDLPAPYQLELCGKYLDAAEVWMSLGIPYHSALSLMQVQQPQAQEALPRAYQILDAIGAKAGLTKVREKAKGYELVEYLPSVRRGPYRRTRQHPAGLTAKEQEVLRYLSTGSSNKEIASALSRSQRTVENHVASILTKLNVSNRMEAMLRIQNEPWLSLRDSPKQDTF
ncbi:AAA family ATPase [Paraglaciecola chathamensis]|uniref:AAA family ATPase n=1 Tax=Paraglaciecola chathamensis TaxID=368405 RepID=A0ABS0W8S7_9ALTE|nr:helix-turn-helix transcriptional regulator [Paraglaciecola chathamensis]MBJ2135180.1 AAA family ATPase [Paraglaciecola chathamensis]